MSVGCRNVVNRHQTPDTDTPCGSASEWPVCILESSDHLLLSLKLHFISFIAAVVRIKMNNNSAEIGFKASFDPFV